MKNKGYRQSSDWIGILIVLIQVVLLFLAKIAFDLKWITNINIWLGEIFWQIFLFFLFESILKEIKDIRLRCICSIVPTIFIVHTIILTFEIKMVITTVLAVLAAIAYGVYFYFIVKRSVNERFVKDGIKNKKSLKEVVQKMDEEEKQIICNCKKLREKYPNECLFIENYTMEAVDEIVDVLRELEYEANDKKEN